MRDDAARPRARLPGQPERALDDDLCGAFQIGVVQDDHRVLAAHLQLAAPRRSHRRVDGPSRRRGPGERQGPDPPIGRERRTGLGPAVHQRDDLRRQPARQQRLHKPLREQWCHGARLEHHRVPRRKRGPDLPGRDVQRKVPRRNGSDNPNGLAPRINNPAVGRRITHALDPVRLSRIEPQIPGRPRNLHRRLGTRLPSSRTNSTMRSSARSSSHRAAPSSTSARFSADVAPHKAPLQRPRPRPPPHHRPTTQETPRQRRPAEPDCAAETSRPTNRKPTPANEVQALVHGHSPSTFTSPTSALRPPTPTTSANAFAARLSSSTACLSRLMASTRRSPVRVSRSVRCKRGGYCGCIGPPVALFVRYKRRDRGQFDLDGAPPGGRGRRWRCGRGG